MDGAKKFICGICNKGYLNPGSLASHKYNQHSMTIVCPFCQIIVDSLSELKSHFKECSYDMEDVPDELTVEEVRQRQEPGDEFFCDICKTGTLTEKDLELHYYDTHPTCLKCGEPFPNTPMYDRHVKICEEELYVKPLYKKIMAQCPICREIHLNSYQLKRHLEDEHSIRKRVTRPSHW